MNNGALCQFSSSEKNKIIVIRKAGFYGCFPIECVLNIKNSDKKAADPMTMTIQNVLLKCILLIQM